MICPVCKGENREEYKFCAYCGSPRPAQQTGKETLALSEPPLSEAPPTIVETLKEAPVIPPAMPMVQPVPLEGNQVISPEPGDQPASDIPDAPPRRKKNWPVTCLIIAVMLFCLGAAALVSVVLLKPEWLPFELPFLKSNDKLVIGLPGESGEIDLYLLRQGKAAEKGLLLAEDVTAASAALLYQSQDTLVNLADAAYPFGAFIPEQDTLLYWYANGEGKISLLRLELDQKAPFTVWEGDASSVTSYVLKNMQDVYITAMQDGEGTCYLSTAGQAAQEKLSGEVCSLSADFSTAYATTLDGSQTSLRLVNLAGNAEYTPLNAQDNVAGVAVTADGLRLAYTNLSDEKKVFFLDSQNGNTVATGPAAYAILDQGFASRGHIGYFITESIAGDLELYLLSDSGASLIHRAQSIAAGMDLNGAHLVYMAGEYDGERALFVRDVSRATDTEVIRGEALHFELAVPLNRIFITATQQNVTTLYSANMDGSGLVSLYSCEDCQLGKISYAPGQPYTFFELHSETGISLLAAQIDQAVQYLVVENWANIALLDTSADGLQLLFAGADSANADSSLYLARLDAQENLTLDDDVDGIANGLFNEKNDAVLYTAITGAGPDDVAIRLIQTDLSEPAEVLYSHAFLAAAQWDTLQSLLTTSSPLLVQGTSYCPNAPLLGRDTPVEGSIDTDTGVCYGYRGTAGEKVTFWATTDGDNDLALSLYDRRGNLLDSNDTGFNGTDPRLIAELPSDNYYFLVVTSGFTPGPYTLSSTAGSSYCPGVPVLETGIEQSGELDDTGQQFFSLSGGSNQTLTFWVESTNLDPTITLYDAEGYILGNDDDSRDGVDPLLTTTLPEDGAYCLEVNNFGFETGPFTVSMAEESVYCPGADTIPVDQSVAGTISGERRTCYAVEVSGGSRYSFIVTSPTDTDTMLELYDSNGNLLISDDDSGSHMNPLLVFDPEQSGTYYVVILGYSSETTGEFELSFNAGYDFCPNAQPIQLGDVINGTLEEDQKACYFFAGTAGQNILVSVDSLIDTTLTLYDADGGQVAFNDDSIGLNPQIRTTLPGDGTYTIGLEVYSGDTGDFTLTFETAPAYTNPFENALLLPANQRVRGEITETDAIFLELFEYQGYGDLYYFEGSGGQTIQVDVFAATIGSALDPWVILFDATGSTVLADNDDSGDTLDSQVVFTLPSDGRIYVLVIDATGEFGTGGSYFYDILLTYP